MMIGSQFTIHQLATSSAPTRLVAKFGLFRVKRLPHDRLTVIPAPLSIQIRHVLFDEVRNTSHCNNFLSLEIQWKQYTAKPWFWNTSLPMKDYVDSYHQSALPQRCLPDWEIRLIGQFERTRGLFFVPIEIAWVLEWLMVFLIQQIME